ncbi:hypothetical protein AVEN_153653-1 [Araneus ventricosus]|uniref:Tc1-like transposase DDE domain-containing protein n=1 Tax=Araneus ventricosus TaxID=182803 RepID=A0A4Y2BRG7_ARAVE|nr:hypothetical protein AVEN_153653-1 [Araneus ventricosus]
MHRCYTIKLFRICKHVSVCTHNCLDRAPPHITPSIKGVLKNHFTEEYVISRHICNLWPPRSSDRNPCDFRLWGHLKHLVSRDNPRTLPDLKDSISRHVPRISQNTLRLAVEHTIQVAAENDGRHVEHEKL